MSEIAEATGTNFLTIRHAPIRRDAAGKPVPGPDGKPVQEAERAYKLAPVDLVEVAGAWETWLEDQAWEALERSAKRWTPAEYERRKDALVEKIAAGDFGVYSEASISAQKNPWREGYRKMLLFQ